MKTFAKILCAALAVSAVPYRFKSDKETGNFEVGSLLWSLKKTCGEEKNTYTVELFPCTGCKKKPAEEPKAAEKAEETVTEAAEEPAEEAVAEECAEECAEEAAAEESAEETVAEESAGAEA